MHFQTVLLLEIVHLKFLSFLCLFLSFWAQDRPRVSLVIPEDSPALQKKKKGKKERKKQRLLCSLVVLLCSLVRFLCRPESAGKHVRSAGYSGAVTPV